VSLRETYPESFPEAVENQATNSPASSTFFSPSSNQPSFARGSAYGPYPRAHQFRHLVLEEAQMKFLSVTLVLTLFGFTSVASAKQPFSPAPKITSAVAFRCF
jgi:hypothetical protein